MTRSSAAKSTLAGARTISEQVAHLHHLTSQRKTKSEAAVETCMAALRESLQMAVTLEFATVPPYLCALWSINPACHSNLFRLK